jgi:CubicO group peptidase (beta-lactamase class C family)
MFRLAQVTIGAAVTLLVAAGSSPAHAQGAGRTTTQAGDSAAIDSIAKRYFALDLAPGMAVAVVRGDEVLYFGGFGFADREQRRAVTAETIFYIASTTKAFTGLAAAIMHERGRFSLDAPLSRYLPDAVLQAPLSADSITIRSLLSHTHGIGNNGPVVWRTAFSGEFESNDELVRLLADHPPEPGGRAYRYGNIGYNVASFAMDRALGRSWKDVLDDEIFRPLDMQGTGAYVSRAPEDRRAMPYRATSSGFERVPYGKADANMQAAGGLVSNARDLARWLEAQLNSGRVDGRQALPATALAEAQRLQATANATSRGLRQVGYALGWQLVLRGSDTLYLHGGGFTGFATLVSFLPRQGIGVAVMANESSLGSALTDVVTRVIYAHLAGAVDGAGVPENFERDAQRAREGIAADRARRAARSQVLPYPLEAYAGVYRNPSFGTVELRVVDGRLRATAGAAQSAVEVYDASRNQLRVELSGSGSVVTVDLEDGRAVRITWDGNTFVRR